MECSICYNIIQKSAVGSCNHHYCFQCLIRWCRFSDSCPKCKTFISAISFDPEYDLLIKELSKLNVDIEQIGNDDGRSYDKNEVIKKGKGVKEKGKGIQDSVHGGGNIREVTMTFVNKDQAGLTIKNNAKGPGIKVSGIDRGGRAEESGIKKGDIILFINNIPCINHVQSVAIIKECMRANKNAVCMLF